MLCWFPTIISRARVAALPPVRAGRRLEPTIERVKTLHNAYDFIVTFLEGMVESTLDVQKENQGLLR